MIESMTGFGSGSAAHAGSSLDVSLRSINNKSFKLTIRMPDVLSKSHHDIEKLIKPTISRGTIYCLVEIDGPLAASYSVDETAVLNYCSVLRRLARKAGVGDDISIDNLVALPGVVRESKASTEALHEMVNKAAKKALKSLLESRRREGQKIEKNLRDLVEKVASLCEDVERLRKKSLRSYSKKLATRTQELITRSEARLDKNDLAREVAILAERSDIAEELHRLKIHTQQMSKALSTRKPVGRQLEFIAQEMLREANTMSAKSLSSELVVPLLKLKSNVDRIREQAQNVQ